MKSRLNGICITGGKSLNMCEGCKGFCGTHHLFHVVFKLFNHYENMNYGVALSVLAFYLGAKHCKFYIINVPDSINETSLTKKTLNMTINMSKEMYLVTLLDS